MHKIGATISKELLLLSRDRSGLLMLFLMPALLVLVMTLVQENVLKTMGESRTRILFIDRDRQEVGQAVEKKLAEMPAVEVVQTIGGKKLDRQAAFARVLKGEFQLCVFVPEGTTAAVKAEALQSVAQALEGESSSAADSAPQYIHVYFDPTVFGGTRSAILQSLELMTFGIEMNEKFAALSRLLPKHIQTVLKKEMGPMLPEGTTIDIPGMKLELVRNRHFSVQESPAGHDLLEKKPTSVQQNVPAWALFGIFFIVVPMAGGMISERQDETLARLRTMPVSYVSVMAGKILAYVGVCLVQFGLILAIGKYILPLLGTPVLEMGSDPRAVALITLSAVLAATGYGILLGTLSRTYEQLSMVGPISIVIAAALGGIMVPVYAMPKIMRQISIYSPLAWGHEAYLNVFVRGGHLSSVVWQVTALLGFFALTLLVSWIGFVVRCRNGG